jgi:hypothetical protein
MNYWYVNTEAKECEDKSPHKKGLKPGRAFVAGVKGGNAAKFVRKLHQLQRGDIIFMYVNTQDVVAVGTVVEPWDGKPFNPPFVYCLPHHTEEYSQEYQATVDWCLRLRDPIPSRKLRSSTGSFARQAIQRITDRVVAKALLEQTHQQARGE